MKPIVCVAMNRAFILFILSLFSFSIYAQNIRVESFGIVMNDATASASPVLDANDDPCALIRLVTTDKEYEIDGNIKRVEKTGELLFYVPSGTRQVTIRHSSLGVLNYSFEQRLQSKATYRMVLPSNTIVIHSEDRGGHYLVMRIVPANAVVHIDGMLENVRDGLLQKFLPYGMHTYRVEAPLYSMEEGSVEIGREKKQLDISLKPNFADVTLKAQGAEIKVNSESKGNDSWRGRLNPGTYLVETVKPGYRNATYTLVVVSGEDRSIDLPMPTPMYASLDVSCNAVNGSVYVDGKHIGNAPDIFKVLAGKHTVELRANGYESKSYTVELAEGEAKKLFAELKEMAKSTYGEQTTAASSGGNGTVNGHEYVDLGLPSGLLWATCNVGANAPEEYGNYYAWGETETKSSYDASNSKTYRKRNLPSDISGNSQYDAARKNWGGSWRMPTRDEFEELLKYCTWTWTSRNGKNGYEVQSKKNGNSIFLPAAGYWSATCWSASHGEFKSAFTFSYEEGINADWMDRYNGKSVRPVSDISKLRDPNELLCIACVNNNNRSIAYFTGKQWDALVENEKSRYAQLGVSIKKNGHEFIIAAKDCQDPEDGDYGLVFGGCDIDFAGVRNYWNWYQVREADITTGYSDTKAIIEQTKGKTDSKGIKGAPAAEAAWNYKANSHDSLQWYLPSHSELYMIYMNIGKINSFLNKYFTDYNSFPEKEKWYWSSTESGSSESWVVNMLYGSNYTYRGHSFRVRAVASVK